MSNISILWLQTHHFSHLYWAPVFNIRKSWKAVMYTLSAIFKWVIHKTYSITKSSINLWMHFFFELNQWKYCTLKIIWFDFIWFKANPPVSQIGWLFNEEPLSPDTTLGIQVRNNSLLIRNVAKIHRGRFQCFAVNSEGRGESEVVNLKVQCKTCTHFRSIFTKTKAKTN